MVVLSAPPTEVQISILHHQALLYLITMKPHDIITQPTNHIVNELNFDVYIFKSVGGTKILARTVEEYVFMITLQILY